VHDSAGAVSALITIKNQNTNQIYGSARAAQGSGAFLVTLPAGAKYSLTFSAKGNQNKEVLVDLTSLQSYNESAVSVKLSTLPEAPLVLAVNTVMNTNSSPTIAAAPSTSTAPVTASAAVVPAAAIAGASEATTAVAAAAKNPVTSATKDSFVPNTKFQEKTMLYVEKYGDISAPGLEFKVQFAALKSGKNYAYPELYKIGKVERLESNDGYTRLTIGGSFKTLRSAFAINKRVVKAGEKEAFVICFYKGKRTTFEELEKQKIFVEKP
jgi:hypothetical protein